MIFFEILGHRRRGSSVRIPAMPGPPAQPRRLPLRLPIPMLAAAVLAFSASAILVGEARAQGTKSEREACTPDVFRLCASEIPSVDRIVSCLNRKKPQLSPACRTVMNGGDKSARR